MKNAHYWSQRWRYLGFDGNLTDPTLLAAKTSNTLGKKVGVLITGYIRIQGSEHLSALNEAMEGSDTYVVTYEPYEDIARHLSNNVLIITEKERADENSRRHGVPAKDPDTVWQWYVTAFFKIWTFCWPP